MLDNIYYMAKKKKNRDRGSDWVTEYRPAHWWTRMYNGPTSEKVKRGIGCWDSNPSFATYWPHNFE